MTILSDALQRHAAERPEVPWLFWAEGWDWRWLSWGEAARRVTAGAVETASAPSLEPLTPAGLIADLAAQAAGGVVRVRGSGGEWVEWTDADLAAAADIVAREVAPAGPPAGGREILVASRSLAEPAERAVLAWAILQGAALLLEPDPASRVTTAAWARPTFFHGTAADIDALARQPAGEPGPLARLLRRPPGLPFGRLRAVLSIEDAVEDLGLWAGRGVRVARLTGLPRCGTRGRGRGI